MSCFLQCIPEGIEVKFKDALYNVLICPASVPELNIIEVTDEGLVVGGAVTLTELSEKLKELVDSIPGKLVNCFGNFHRCYIYCLAHRTGVFSAMLNMLRLFAGPQIRNVSVSNPILLMSILMLYCALLVRHWEATSAMPALSLISIPF